MEVRDRSWVVGKPSLAALRKGCPSSTNNFSLFAATTKNGIFNLDLACGCANPWLVRKHAPSEEGLLPRRVDRLSASR